MRLLPGLETFLGGGGTCETASRVGNHFMGGGVRVIMLPGVDLLQGIPLVLLEPRPLLPSLSRLTPTDYPL